MTLEEILALPDIGQKISYLKKGRKTELPDRCKLWDDWNPERHEIMVRQKKVIRIERFLEKKLRNTSMKKRVRLMKSKQSIRLNR